MTKTKYFAFLAAFLLTVNGKSVDAETYAPPHVSDEWKHLFATHEAHWDIPEPDDLDAWRAWDAAA